MKSAVLVLGATSAIGRSIAERLALQGFPLFLASRDLPELERIAADIKIRSHVDVKTGFFDVKDFETHADFLQNVVAQMNGLEGVVSAIGILGEQQRAEKDFQEAHMIIAYNFTGICGILSQCANYFAQRQMGFIVGISSVAGDRGRMSNYFYGAAKGGLTLFLQGLRNRLYHSHVHVMTVKPGFVDTAMTFGMANVFLVASPQDVGEKVVKGILSKRNMIYVPWFWRYIMVVIKSIPEALFKKLKL